MWTNVVVPKQLYIIQFDFDKLQNRYDILAGIMIIRGKGLWRFDSMLYTLEGAGYLVSFFLVKFIRQNLHSLFSSYAQCFNKISISRGKLAPIFFLVYYEWQLIVP